MDRQQKKEGRNDKAYIKNVNVNDNRTSTRSKTKKRIVDSDQVYEGYEGYIYNLHCFNDVNKYVD